jgi:hypothetical protein
MLKLGDRFHLGWDGIRTVQVQILLPIQDKKKNDIELFRIFFLPSALAKALAPPFNKNWKG